MRRRHLRLLSLLATLVACSDAGLQPLQETGAPPPDNLLQISGSLCTDSPVQSDYPVKILFVIDTSGSMQFTDPTQQILKATEDVVNRLGSNPSVTFAIITFNGIVRINSDDPLPQDGSNDYDHVSPTSLGKNAEFVPGSQLAALGALAAITMRDGPTDYEGALGATYRLLEQDMINTTAAQRARTKYIIIYLSDGWPNPQCNTSCNPAEEQPVCISRASLPADAVDAYPELKACEDYNQPYQIYAYVDQIMHLETVYSVGDMRMNTVWLYDPNDMVSTGMGFVPSDAKDLLATMAMDGDGQFADYYNGADITFANIDYSAILEPFALSQILAWNFNATPGLTGYDVDSDGDGLSDALENTICTDPLQADTDGDGYNDSFEYQRMNQGFDPNDNTKPWFGCTDTADLDSDTLPNCAEQVLGTDPTALTGTDSDGDHIPDGLEVLYGTNPLVNDTALDSDSDGNFNLQEFVGQTNPLVADPILYRDHRTSIQITDQGLNAAQSHCYSFQVSHIELVGTSGPRAQPLTPVQEKARCMNQTSVPAGSQEVAALAGRNRIYLYFGQNTTDAAPGDPGHWKVACVDVVYSPPLYKQPASGQITLTAANLYDAAVFNPKTDCITAQ